MPTSLRTERKVIHAAGILIVQPHVELGARWQAELLDFGMSGVHVVPSVDRAVEVLNDRAFLGIIVAAETVGEASRAMARLRPDESAAESGAGAPPILLVLSHPNRATEAAARHIGFEAIIAAPAHTRLIYRRMGSLMQKARRNAKLRADVGTQGGEIAVELATKAND